MYLNHKGLYLAEILVPVKSTRSVSRKTDRERGFSTHASGGFAGIVLISRSDM
jgi:hypothetical protein